MNPSNQSRQPEADARQRRSGDALSDPRVLIEDPLAIGRTGKIGIGRAEARDGWALRWNGSRWVAKPDLSPTAVQTMDCVARIGDLVLVDPTGGAVDVLIPASPGDGSEIVVKNHSASVNTITIIPEGQNTIDGATTNTITTARGARRLLAIEGGWVVG